jgi:hypothetical protein
MSKVGLMVLIVWGLSLANNDFYEYLLVMTKHPSSSSLFALLWRRFQIILSSESNSRPLSRLYTASYLKLRFISISFNFTKSKVVLQTPPLNFCFYSVLGEFLSKIMNPESQGVKRMVTFKLQIKFSKIFFSIFNL